MRKKAKTLSDIKINWIKIVPPKLIATSKKYMAYGSLIEAKRISAEARAVSADELTGLPEDAYKQSISEVSK